MSSKLARLDRDTTQTTLSVSLYYRVAKHHDSSLLITFFAFSIGALAVRGIPNWTEMREKTLPMSHRLAALPADQLAGLEDETSMYNAGWSFGKEKMGDTPDFAKASFYYNPLLDDPSPELRAEYPWALPANKWPDEASIPQFRNNCREIGIEMKNVATLLAKHIDRLLVSQIPGYQPGLFAEAMRNTEKAKARMLYYYPIQPPSEESAAVATPPGKDNWIAWHNDSGFLTCLAGEIFVNHDSGEVISNPEPDTAGLWIADRYMTRSQSQSHNRMLQCTLLRTRMRPPSQHNTTHASSLTISVFIFQCQRWQRMQGVHP